MFHRIDYNWTDFNGCIALPNVWSQICLCSAGNLSFKVSIKLKKKNPHHNFLCAFRSMIRSRHVNGLIHEFYKDIYTSFKLVLHTRKKKSNKTIYMQINTLKYLNMKIFNLHRACFHPIRWPPSHVPSLVSSFNNSGVRK